MREFIDVGTSKNATLPSGKVKEPPTPNGVKEPGLPINVPLSIVRWIGYSLLFSGLTSGLLGIPVSLTINQWVGISLILGHFASQLNALIKK